MKYYDERAPEYDEVYLGKSPSIPEPEAYARDVKEIKTICRGFGSGHLIDIGCGTGFWMPCYAKNCNEITLVDQSRSMLVQCQRKVNELDSDICIHLIKGDFFDVRFLSKVYDTTLVAFLVSHLDDEHVQIFFRKIKSILKPNAEMLWIDGSWSRRRARYRHKESLQERVLNDGRRFYIFKKYFEERDVYNLLNKYNLDLRSLYMGDVFFAAHAILKH
jgi:putative AdoMet-dependent methyltransferase